MVTAWRRGKATEIVFAHWFSGQHRIFVMLVKCKVRKQALHSHWKLETRKGLQGYKWLCLHCSKQKKLIELLPHHSYKTKETPNFILCLVPCTEGYFGPLPLEDQSMKMCHPGRTDVWPWGVTYSAFVAGKLKVGKKKWKVIPHNRNKKWIIYISNWEHCHFI